MTFHKFLKETKQYMEKNAGETYQIIPRAIEKNNGVKLEGLCIMETGRNISPTIYLNEYYERYLEGMEIEEIASEIWKIYGRSKMEKNIDVTGFLDYKEARKRIVYKVINYEKNKERLADMPYIPYLDMAIVFYYLISNEEMEGAVINIHNNHLEMWGVSTEEIYQEAKQNTPVLLPYKLCSMQEIIQEMAETEGDYERESPENTHCPMYILTNAGKINGASTILYDGILRDFAKASGKNVMVLPSSVHEVILVPAAGAEDKNMFDRMVADVNESQVEAEEVLADHAYLYLLETDKLTV